MKDLRNNKGGSSSGPGENVYSKEEINDYINLVNSCPKKMKIESLNKMLKEETDPLKQANILSDIMKLKGVGND